VGTVPAIPTGLAATAGDTQVSLAWNAASGASSYNIFRGTAAGGEGTTPYKTGVAGTSLVDLAVVNGNTYFYKVAAVNGAGSSALSAEVSATPKASTTVPGTPTGLAATAGDGQVALSWSPSAGATSYNLYRANTAGGEGTTPVVTGITGATYTNTGLTNGTSYFFKVAAVNSAGVSAPSAEVTATPKSSVTIPTTPANLVASAGDGQVALSWGASSGATSYNLYRSTTAGGEGTTPFATGITSTSYTNTGLVNGTTYYYKVAALNTAGLSAQSAEASATPASQGTGVATVKTSQASASGPWWGEDDLTLSSTAPITAMSLTLTLQKTAGLSYNGQYNTTGGFAQTHSDTASTVVYTFTLNPGQTLNAGSWLFAAQYGGTGTAHASSGDTYSLSYTSGGKAFTLNGHF